MNRHRPEIIPANRPSLLRRATSLIAIFGLLVSGLLPLAQATALSSGAGTLLAEICSPNGVRYVEIDLGGTNQDAPPAPPLGPLDHCPGCLAGGGLALLPAAGAVLPPLVADGIAPAPRHAPAVSQIEAGFRPRAPPVAS